MSYLKRHRKWKSKTQAFSYYFAHYIVTTNENLYNYFCINFFIIFKTIFIFLQKCIILYT